MTDVYPIVLDQTADLTAPRPVPHREGTEMLIHEALARSQRQEAEDRARRYRLARSVAAGRRWARLAEYADRRARRSAERARAAAC